MAFVRVARFEDLPENRGYPVRVADEEIALWRVDDAVFAMSNVCPHAGLPLDPGPRRGCVVWCPGHGWDFDLRTGLAPGQTRGRGLETYTVRVEDGDVLIEIPAP